MNCVSNIANVELSIRTILERELYAITMPCQCNCMLFACRALLSWFWYWCLQGASLPAARPACFVTSLQCCDYQPNQDPSSLVFADQVFTASKCRTSRI